MWRHASDKALSICQVHPPSAGVGVASAEYINNDTPLTRKATSDMFTFHFHLPFHLVVVFVALKGHDIPEIIAVDLVFENFKDVFSYFLARFICIAVSCRFLQRPGTDL